MAGPEFFQTLMGRQFFDGTMPKIARQLERLNSNLEKMLPDHPAERVVELIREVMFLEAKKDGTGFFMNPDKECDSETIDNICRILIDNDFGPEKGRQLETKDGG